MSALGRLSVWERKSEEGQVGEGSPDGAQDSGRHLPPGPKPPGPGAGRAHRSPSSPPRPLSPRGMVVVADKTAELYEKTYWASYNIP